MRGCGQEHPSVRFFSNWCKCWVDFYLADFLEVGNACREFRQILTLVMFGGLLSLYLYLFFYQEYGTCLFRSLAVHSVLGHGFAKR